MILQTQGLKVGYGKTVVVTDIDLAMLQGQLVGLLGPNGCGKSTLLRTLAHMLAPLGGAISLKGRDLSRIKQGDLAREMAVVLTERLSPGLLTAFDIASMGRYPYTGFMGRLSKEDKGKVWESLELVDAEQLASRCFGELSDGETQKVLLARALCQEPELIVLDEPTSHLDARHRIEVMIILRRLVQEKGTTVITSLHDIDLTMKVCDVVILVKEGRVLSYGPPEDILRGQEVEELYDMRRATFSCHLGGIELVGAHQKDVFVVAGAGSGANLYRTLAKHDFGVLTGVLPENDVDFQVAEAIGCTLISEKPYQRMSADSCAKALVYMKQAYQVVDAGFPVGELNQCNVELVQQALSWGKITYTLRSEEESQQLYGPWAARVVRCSSVSELLRKMRDVQSLSIGGG